MVRASAEFFEESPNGFDVNICALDTQLGTIAWLKKPMAAPDLPRRQIVADCVAALEPGDRLWEQFLDVLEQSKQQGGVAEEDYALLRYTMSARRALVEETLGDVRDVTLGSVPSILRRARESITRDTQDQIRIAREQQRDAQVAAEAEAERANRAETQLQRERLEHATELAASSELQRAELVRQIGNKAHRRARRYSTGIFVLLAAAVIAGALGSGGVIGGGGALVLVAIAKVVATTHTVVGRSVSELARRVERLLERWFEEREQKSLGVVD